MRTPRRLGLIAALLVSLVPALAFAASVPRLTGSITDPTGALDGNMGEIQAALDAVLKQSDVQLFVLFVGSTEDMTSTEFVDETARVNSLGANDALLLVAVDDHTDAIWVSDSLAITNDELDSIIADTLEPSLREGDFAAATIATAEALGNAQTAGPEPVVTPAPDNGGGIVIPGGEPGAGSGGPGFELAPVFGISLLAIGVVLLGVWLASRLSARRVAEERDRATGLLAREANAQLVAMDERTRTADQEADFVEAEFDAAEAAPFRAAIAAAKEELRAAFSVRQKLDDAEPETPAERESMLKDIVERCGQAGAELDKEAAHIAELRHLERDAATILAALPAQVDAQEQRLPASEATLAALATYADASRAAVKGNVVEARKGLAGARAAIKLGTDAIAKTDNRTAAHQIAIAQDGLTGATALLDAVDKLAAAIKEAESNLPAALQAADSDLAAARAAVPAVPAAPAGAADPHAAALAAAGAALEAAKQVAATRPLDPLAAAQLAATARKGAGDLLATIRQDAAQQAQLVAALASSIATAQATVDRASSFVATRRGGVGRQARTRLAEAEGSMEAALKLKDSDPKSAMDQAHRAAQLGDEAYSLASNDFAGWNSGGASPVGGGSNVAGAILGGIIGGMILGGGRGGGWGGSSWGSSGPLGGGGGWGGIGHSSGGSFGGGFGGGGFGGGGGGHSAGGHW